MSSVAHRIDATPLVQPKAERRAHVRFPTIMRIGTLVTPDDRGLCRIKNISDAGILLETSLRHGLRDWVLVGFTDKIIFEAQVAWLSSDATGLAFPGPIDSF